MQNKIKVCKEFEVVFSIICGKNIALRGCEWFWLLGCSNFCIFHWNIPIIARNFAKYH